jgi:hypothetical protein
MKYEYLNRFILVLAAVCLMGGGSTAQKARHKAAQKAPPVRQYPIFAVRSARSSGPVTLEPLAVIAGGKVSAFPGAGDTVSQKTFAAKYYKPGSTYNVIFGGTKVGTVIVKSGDTADECSGNRAQASFSPPLPNIKGLVMALATNAPLTGAAGQRRMPTADERKEIEQLVRSEFIEKKVSEAALKKLRYQNLTAMGIDRERDVAFVGSYWTETSSERRDLLFFIAEKNAGGKYLFSYKNYSAIKPADVMSGDLKDLDGGIGHELLLDIFDYDGDGVSEVFTITQAFEGNNFQVYKRKAGKWDQVLQTYNYHCAY